MSPYLAIKKLRTHSQKPIVSSETGILLTLYTCLPAEACKSKKGRRTKPRRLLTFRMISNHQMMLKCVNLSQACFQLPVTCTRVFKSTYIYVFPLVLPRPWPLSEGNGAVLQGIPGVACCIHDILFISADEESHVRSP